MKDNARLYRLTGAAVLASVLEQQGFGSIAHKFDGNDPVEVLFSGGIVHIHNDGHAAAMIFINLAKREARVVVEDAYEVVRASRRADFHEDDFSYDQKPHIDVLVDLTEILAEVEPIAALPPPPAKRLRKHGRKITVNTDI